MSRIYEEITAKGLFLPNVVLAQWGLEEGTKVEIESRNKTIVIKPREVTAREITRRAYSFLLHKVGDATAIKPPVRKGNKWKVTVTLPHRKRVLGQLTFTANGILLTSESNTPKQLSEKANED